VIKRVKVETLQVGQLNTNCYLYYDPDSSQAAIIDPGDDADFIINKIQDLNIHPIVILASHGHFDHVLAATELKLAFRIPFLINKMDGNILKRQQKTAKYFTGVKVDPPPLVDKFLKNNQVISVGQGSLKILTTPGHTPGSVCFYDPKFKICFSGDTLFSQGGYGRTDLAGGNKNQIGESLKKILTLPKDTCFYPGHGPKTTVDIERHFYN
jgi:hydroxyacylglutathione hydrolase